MRMIKRKHCVICEGSLRECHTFNDFPTYMGVTNSAVENDAREDMIFSKCSTCSCVQLSNLIPLDILYSKPHNSAIGKMWDRHHYEFYQFIKSYAKGTIMEIGGGNLKLARHLEKETSVEKIIVHDYNFYQEDVSNKIIFKSPSESSNTQREKVDMIVHSHLIEHLYEPVSDIENMASLLPIGAHMAIAMPLIDVMIADKFTNAMNFEHTYMLTYEMAEMMLNMAGLHIVDKKYFSPHIAFVIAEKTGNKSAPVVKYEGSVKAFNEFISYYKEEVEKIQSKIKSKKEDTFIFGAHIFTQYLFGFGLSEGLFSNTLDNDPDKIGNRLYGTSLKVKSPKILKEVEYPVVVLKAAMYTEEIKKDILENINPNTKFIL